MQTNLAIYQPKSAQLLKADVMHKRLLPKVNRFDYGVYYLSLPLDAIESQDQKRLGQLAINRFSLHSFYTKDHGYRNNSSLRKWATDILTQYGQPEWQDITLVCMPRVLGYVFNPVSFWICRDENNHIQAVICEVNNTFGQTHTYLCLPPKSKPDKMQSSCSSPINSDTWLIAEKCFHVSPFLPREGEYHFRFNIQSDSMYINIDYHNNPAQKVLLTSLKGNLTPLSRASRLKAFLRCPLVTLKAIALIHYQAVKIIAKKIGFIKLPVQQTPNHSTTRDK